MNWLVTTNEGDWFFTGGEKRLLEKRRTYIKRKRKEGMPLEAVVYCWRRLRRLP